MTPAEAREIALVAHGNQMYGFEPYHVHLDAVASVVREFGLGDEMECAAYLHDVLEDTGVTAGELAEEGVNEKTLNAVEAVTGRGANRKARNADAYAKLAAYPTAINLKLCDRLANALAARATAPDKFAMYRREYPSFRAALYPHGGSPELWLKLDALFPAQGHEQAP